MKTDLTFFLITIPLGFVMTLIIGIILVYRFYGHFSSVWRKLALFVFFATVLYLSSFALLASACLYFFFGDVLWMRAVMPTALVFGTFLFIIYMFNYVFEKERKGLLPVKTDPVQITEFSEADTESTEERILRQLTVLFEEKKIYREFDLRIEDVSMRIGTNRTYVSGVMNNRCGCHFQSFVNQFRIKEARELLVSTSWPVSRIAQFVGYKNVNTFNACFRENVGQTPTEFRRSKS